MPFITMGTFEIGVYLHGPCSTGHRLLTRPRVVDVT